MSNDKHNAVWDWLMQCPHIRDMHFNFSESGNGDTQIMPVDTVAISYIDKSELRYYDVTLAIVSPISFDPNDTANITSQLDIDAIIVWIDAQEAVENYPVFPIGNTVNEITALPSYSGYVAAQDGSSAKYQLQFRIEYLQNGGF